MRIVHEIESLATVSGGFRPYTAAKGHDKSSGIIVDLLILVEEDRIIPSEEIHIEGDGAYILHVLEDAVRMIKDTAKIMVKEGQIVENWNDLEAKKARFSDVNKKST